MRRVLILFALLGGCRTQPYPIDAGSALEMDSAAPLAVSCAHHDRVEVALSRFELADSPPFSGGAVRARLGFPWRPACDVLGDIEVKYLLDSGPDYLVVAHLWRSTDAACTDFEQAAAVVILSDTLPFVGRVTAADGAAGGTLGLTIQVAARPSGTCQAMAPGQPCERNCQCTAMLPEARCIPVPGGGPDSAGICAVSCNDDAVCPDATPRCLISGGTDAPFVCALGNCPGDDSCPFGQRCQSIGAAHACRPPSQLTTTPRSCQCSSDCGFGAVCTLVGEDALGCVMPCATTSDCSAHGGCGNTCVQGRCLATPC